MNKIINIFYVFLENIDYYSVLIFVFITVIAIILGLIFFFSRTDTFRERLNLLLDTENKSQVKKVKLFEEKESNFVAKFAKPLNKVVTLKEGATKNKLRLKLIQGGFRSERAVLNYLALKVFLGLLFLGGYLITIFFINFTFQVLMVGFALFFIGLILPDIVLHYLTQARKNRLLKACPDALDLMVLCAEAGLGLDMTIHRVGKEIRSINSDLSDEFHLTHLEIRAGRPRNESLQNMALRTGVPEIKNLMTILIQTNRFGTSLAKALRVHSDAMRVKRRQIAEEIAAKLGIKLLFPLILFVFPALFLVLIGPAAIRIMKLFITNN